MPTEYNGKREGFSGDCRFAMLSANNTGSEPSARRQRPLLAFCHPDPRRSSC